MPMNAPLANISLSALGHNIQKIKSLAPTSKILPMVKANAYGHGMVLIAKALEQLGCDALGVARWEEAKILRREGVTAPIVIFSGLLTQEQLQWSADNNAQAVIYDASHVELLDTVEGQLTVWLKLNTGMNRLGLPLGEADVVLQSLEKHASVKAIILCTHHACADELASEYSIYQKQMERFWECAKRYPKLETSVANSATILRAPQEQMGDWVRPGIMLYGGSPFADKTATALDIQPVMQLEAPIISVYEIEAGEGVGYGQTFIADKKTNIAILAIGYGDGLLRYAGGKTSVLIQDKLCPIIGRVSMDLIAIDISNLERCQVGDVAILWGENYPAELMAKDLATINYELLTQVSERVSRKCSD